MSNSDLWEKTQNTGEEIRRQAGPNMEPTGKEKKRTPNKYVENGSPERHKEDRLQLEGA